MKKKLDRVLIGDALAGRGNEIAHVKLLVGPRGGPAETTFCQRLVATGSGSESLLVKIAPDLPCKPNTLLVNHNAFVRPYQSVLLYGPVQAAVAQAVTRFALGNRLAPDELNDLYLIVSALVHPDATDKNRVFVQNRDAVATGLQNLFERASPARLDEDLATLEAKLNDSPTDPY